MLVGALRLAPGYAVLSMDSETLLCPAAGLLMVGHALFKPSINSAVGKLYPRNEPRRDDAYSLLYVAFNIGQGKPAEASSRRKDLRILSAAQSAECRLSWTFGGTRHLLETDPIFAPHRAQLLSLQSAPKATQPSSDPCGAGCVLLERSAAAVMSAPAFCPSQPPPESPARSLPTLEHRVPYAVGKIS